MWEHAAKISAESGFEYFDRYGNQVNAGKRFTTAKEALELYVRDNVHIFRLS